MASRQLDEERIFHTARGIPDAAIRGDYLDQICTGDQALRERVEALLAVHEREQEFLKSVPAPAATVDQPPISEAAGQEIGRFKLLQEIGEGGFGVVYMAEQTRPVRRKVALKVIKPGMDTKGVVARFEAERQALAMMDHENIARVLDGGTTDTGRPYFVMELVKGVPITEYCDQNHLPTVERLKLFITVCQAVHHAHQKGVIHRDLKPSNVLVTLHDGKPVVKVIDFGVAKAINQQLTEKTLFTSYGQMIGTPQYMSPEQAEMSGLDVDTRSDIYSLGVLLYELLTGTTPLESERLRTAGYAEMQRLIREEEPPKPSTRLSTSGEKLTVIAKHRATAPEKLARSLRGELDWIVMKSLEKDRGRRYDTANGLSDDVRRYLEDQPILARPPSLGYHLAKFSRRYRWAIVIAISFIVVLLYGIGTTTWLWTEARGLARIAERQADRANKEAANAKRMAQGLREQTTIAKAETKSKQEALSQLAEVAFREATLAALSGDQDRGKQALALAKETQLTDNRIATLEGLLALSRGSYPEVIEIAKRILADETKLENSDRIAAYGMLVIASLWDGYDDRSEIELANMRDLEPHSDIDRLFLAYAHLAGDWRIAQRYLDEAPTIQRTPVGLNIRGYINFCRGNFEQCARDYEYVDILLPNSALILGQRVCFLAMALDTAKRDGRTDDAARHSQSGRLAAQRLISFSDYPIGGFSCWLFHRADGDESAATGAIQRVGEHPGSYCFYLAADCLSRSKPELALLEFRRLMKKEHLSGDFSQLGEAHLRQDSQDRAAAVRELVTPLLKNPSFLVRRHAICALCLAASPAEIERTARDALASSNSTLSKVPDPWLGDVCLRFLAGDECLSLR